MPNGRPSRPDAEAETVTEPTKLIRIASMAHQVLEELHHDGFGDAARSRVDTAYKDSLEELRSVLSDDLRRELERLAAPLEQVEPGSSPPPQSELRVAEAQLAGWLEGLIQGVQASVAAQQTADQVAEAQRAQRAQQQPQPPTPQDRHRYR